MCSQVYLKLAVWKRADFFKLRYRDFYFGGALLSAVFSLQPALGK
jgi:hypothetical protein